MLLRNIKLVTRQVTNGSNEAQKPFVGLTDEEIKSQWSVFWEADCHPWAIDFARAIEAKLKEKNG